MIKQFVIWVARKFKGSSYQIDPRLPLSSLITISMIRFISLLRCVMKGVKFSFKLSELVFVGPGVVLRNRKMIRFGKSVSLGRNVTIDGLGVKGVMLGDRVSIGAYSIIEATGIISDLGEGCSIGNDSGIGAFSIIGAAGGVWIGNNVIMGKRVSFHSENHCFERTDIPIRMQGVTRQGIRIEDDCWVGANVTFLDGAYVGEGCVIAAGAVVRGEIPPYSVIAGIPARVIKTRKGLGSPSE